MPKLKKCICKIDYKVLASSIKYDEQVIPTFQAKKKSTHTEFLYKVNLDSHLPQCGQLLAMDSVPERSPVGAY